MTDTPRYGSGTIVDNRYRIVRELGRGGFATVFEAMHLQLDRPAALKVMQPTSFGNPDIFIQRFLNEARIIAKLDHPNVVRIFDFGLVDGTQNPYLAMEMLEGHDLRAELDLHGPLEATRAHALFSGVLDALAEGHDLGIVHKDLKPSNLFLARPNTEKERLVILDYGISYVEEDPGPRLTQEGSYAGTPAYMPPEYIQSRIVTPCFDVYQMGLIFIEALTGEPVVTATSSLTYMLAHIEGKLRIPEGFEHDRLGRVLLKALELDPENRYANAGEFRDAVARATVAAGTTYTLPALSEEQLAQAGAEAAAKERGTPRAGVAWSQSAPSSAPTVPTAPQAVAAAPSAPSAPIRPPAQTRKKSRGPLVFLLVLVGGLALIAALGVVLIAIGVMMAADAVDEELEQLDGVSVPELIAAPELAVDGLDGLDMPLPSLPDSHGEKVYSFVLASSMAGTVEAQLEFYDASVQQSGLSDGSEIFAPQQVSTLLDTAVSQIETATRASPKLANVDAAAETFLVELRSMNDLLERMEDYYHVRKGYESDGMRTGRQLHDELTKARKRYRNAQRKFDHRVDGALSKYLKDQRKRYADDEFLAAATDVMLETRQLISYASTKPNGSKMDARLKAYDTRVQQLRDVTRRGGSSLSSRFQMTQGLHERYVDSARDTYKQARELRDEAANGGKPQTAYIRMQLHSMLGIYNTLTRF